MPPDSGTVPQGNAPPRGDEIDEPMRSGLHDARSRFSKKLIQRAHRIDTGCRNKIVILLFVFRESADFPENPLITYWRMTGTRR